ncbi:hypothetical protein PPACK8108_LOCUS24140 [Phakopsora pachyrhizi]|uniref:Uncharacterized protein n=1 Tax=Phakopsora pachyrhizi TaxID=170000 RepID=A0AAV0BRD7_PHAPC|nr:hypothetical protein PPACK8108_LOCUS24140 [Phakopsora pachyrhizi]
MVGNQTQIMEVFPNLLRYGKGGERRDLREDEGVAVEGNKWQYWKEEQKLGGGAHQAQSDWRKTTRATDL